MNNLYKQIYEEKVDVIERELFNFNIEKKKLKKKEIIQRIIYIFICMGIEVLFFFSSQLLEPQKLYYIAMLVISWLGFWMILDTAYSIVNSESVSGKIKIFMEIFLYISFIGAAFIASIISVVEVFSKKVKIVEIYKHLFEVVCSICSALCLGLAGSYLIIRVIEKGCRTIAICQRCNWDFLLWIIWFIFVRYLYRFFLMLLVRTNKEMDGKVIRKNIYSEMEIPFYIVIIFSMVIIWGGNLKGAEGYINASTVWVLYGTLEKRISE